MTGTEKHSTSRERTESAWVVPAILVLAAVLRVVAVGRYSVWTDEASTLFISRWSLGRMLSTVYQVDVNPPLYYLFLWVWARLGESIWWMRFSSVVAGLVSVYLTYLLAGKMLGRKAALAAAFLMSVTPLHVYLSNQARYPAFLTVLALASTYFLVEVVENGGWKRAIAYVVFTTLMLYTHYYAFFVLAFQIAYVAIGPTGGTSRKAPFAALAAVALCYLPWLPVLARQFVLREAAGVAQHIPIPLLLLLVPTYFVAGFTDWFLPQTLKGIVPWTLSPGSAAETVFYIAIVLPALALALAGLLGKKTPASGRRFVGLFLGVPLLLFFASSFFLDIYRPRYLLPILPAFCMAVGAGMIELVERKRTFGIVLSALAVIVPTVSLADYFFVEHTKEDWKGVARIIQERERDGDLVLLYNLPSRLCFEMYYEGELPVEFITYHYPGQMVEPRMVEEELPAYVDAFDRLWVVHYYPSFADSSGSVERFARENLFEIGVPDDIPYDPRFYLKLYATNRRTLYPEYSPRLDFGRATHHPSQVEEGVFPGEGEWRWIGGRASVCLRVCEGCGRLRLRALVNLEYLGRDVLNVAVFCNGEDAGRFTVRESGIVELETALPQECVSGDVASLSLVSDAVFLPDEVFGDGDRSPHSIMISGVELR